MSLPDRKEEQVRRLLEGPHPSVPPDLAVLAAERGRRLLRRRHALRAALWLLLFGAAVVFALWAAFAQPWVTPPVDTTPPLEGW
ncbi:hypothetical protein NKH77_33195 [Streptomyces sp. M19]